MAILSVDELSTEAKNRAVSQLAISVAGDAKSLIVTVKSPNSFGNCSDLDSDVQTPVSICIDFLCFWYDRNFRLDDGDPTR
ncbi:MAG: hypothetical protein Q9182_005269 [Xanthomendoza sp. 2 TL-2023]